MRRLLATLVLLPVLVTVLCTGCGDDGTPDPAPAYSTGSPTGAPTRYDQYVAIGDSYTAAPLVPPTDTSTICLRSNVNYPALLAKQMAGTTLTDVSCSGARTRNVVEAQRGANGSVPPQLDALRRGTDLVTIGLGGNDHALFGGTLGECLKLAGSAPQGSPCTDWFDGTQDVQRTLDDIRSNIAAVVTAVHDRAPKARIVVVGYPQMVPESGTCDLLPLATGDYAFARKINHGLTDAVEAGAKDADAEYLDLWEPSAGHDICSDEPWVNGRITSADVALAYHPLAIEQQEVAHLLFDLLAGDPQD